MTTLTLSSQHTPIDHERVGVLARALLDMRDRHGAYLVCPARLDRAIAILANRADWTALVDGRWLVPASNGKDAYIVGPDPRVCTCPDARERAHWCKHGLAVELHRRLSQLPPPPPPCTGCHAAPATARGLCARCNRILLQVERATEPACAPPPPPACRACGTAAARIGTVGLCTPCANKELFGDVA